MNLRLQEWKSSIDVAIIFTRRLYLTFRNREISICFA
uniref:Uncharacterized protein n=1 Tax=Anguilla anguilla TaxID=7936 RepID=A0A0E9UZA6_ANGAN